MKFKVTIGAFIGFVALTVSLFFAAVVAVIDYRVTSKLERGIGNIRSLYIKTSMGPAIQVEVIN